MSLSEEPFDLTHIRCFERLVFRDLMNRKQSLEVLSLRVSDLLDGLDQESTRDVPGQSEDAQIKFVCFRQKLESLLSHETKAIFFLV